MAIADARPAFWRDLSARAGYESRLDMIDTISWAGTLLLAMIRTLCMLAVLPIGGGSSAGRAFVLPMAVAVGLCVHQAGNVPEVTSVLFYALALKEGAVGIALGWMISRMFMVVGAAGALIDQVSGYTVGQLFNPSLGRSVGPVESLYSMLLILILMSAGNGYYFAKVILATYQAWPVSELVPAASIKPFVAMLLGQGVDLLVNLSIQMAAPIMAMLMFADISIVLLSRYTPEFNPQSASLALKALLLTLMLLLSIAGQMGYLHRLMHELTRVQ
ncbi:type III secretion protein [Dyella monticola]|uniref:Type III secretion protein n=1 Tax=Dyella monticola TaxID=1927958 RepID=A0A370X2Z0_9GAMM|nr:flagellar biosynthetic protein FliR [Dyella monticola]RDS82784.1 type III secretion protein [Dyella monticola]